MSGITNNYPSSYNRFDVQYGSLQNYLNASKNFYYHPLFSLIHPERVADSQVMDVVITNSTETLEIYPATFNITSFALPSASGVSYYTIQGNGPNAGNIGKYDSVIESFNITGPLLVDEEGTTTIRCNPEYCTIYSTGFPSSPNQINGYAIYENVKTG